jgi:hypothetical protein
MSDVFIRYVEYKEYMRSRYPAWSILSYRDWLDFGSKQ